MSEITRGVIGMPFDMAMGSELSRRQFHSIAQALLAENELLKADAGQWQKAFTRIAGELSVMALTHADMTEEAPLQQAIDFVKGAMVERDQLKAENERLERNRDMWKAQVKRQAEQLASLRKEGK